MKRILFFIISFFLFLLTALSQANKAEMEKEILELKKEIVQTEKEIAEARKSNLPDVKEMEAELVMMKKALVIAENSLKGLSKTPDKKIQEIADKEQKAIPKKDPARIAKVSKTIMSDAELNKFLSAVVSAIEKKLDTKIKSAAEAIMNEVKSKHPSSNALGNAASGCWILGANEAAVWMMGKACMSDPGNPDNLNNFASFLTMTGAEELALPVLQKLNIQFPRNSTLLNNIAQAWFGLGDIPMAEKYIDSAIKIFGFHSQANYTKSLIEESKGNKEAAKEALKKSMRYAYSEEKAAKLKKLGGELKNKDLPWKFSMPQDPLGLQKFVVPGYAKSVEQADVLAPQWEVFRKNLWNLSTALKERDKQVTKEIENMGEERAKEAVAAVLAGKNPMQQLIPPFFLKAKTKLILEMKDIDGAAAYQGKKALEQYTESLAEVDKLVEAYKNKEEAFLNKVSQMEKQNPEHNPERISELICETLTDMRNELLMKANTILEQSQNNYIEYLRKKLNTQAYYTQYLTADEPSFEMAKINIRQEFLNVLHSLKHIEEFSCSKKAEKRDGKLADFDDINCQKKIEMNMIWVKAVFTCNKSKVDYEAFFFRGSHAENLNTGEILGGTAELGIKLGLGERGLGPIKAEIEAEASAFIEYDKSGITDGGIKAGVGAEIGIDSDIEIIGGEPSVETGSGIDTPSVGVGVETRIGWNSGPSSAGKGILSGIQIK
jgi:hypothetical protein